MRRRIPTGEGELVDFVRSISGKKRVVVEESQMADWVARALIPHVNEFIRCQPQHNRLISESENKHDEQDAYSLAELLYLNKLKPVHHPDWAFRQLREGVRAYWYSSWELTRAKNRLKAHFLFNGLHCEGDSVYAARHRKAFRLKLKERSANVNLADILFKRLDHCREMKAMHIRVLRTLTKPVREEVR